MSRLWGNRRTLIPNGIYWLAANKRNTTLLWLVRYIAQDPRKTTQCLVSFLCRGEKHMNDYQVACNDLFDAYLKPQKNWNNPDNIPESWKEYKETLTRCKYEFILLK